MTAKRLFKKFTSVLFYSILISSIIFVPNFVYAQSSLDAISAVAAADKNKQSQNIVSEMMCGGGINAKVFQKADEFLKEKFHNIKGRDWVVNERGFFRRFKNNGTEYFMIIKWNGQFEVKKYGFFSNTNIYKDDWTKWLE